MTCIAALLHRLARSKSGAALTEFALATPLLLTAGLWGVEVAHQAVIQMRVSQIAVLIADNASRVGENSLLGETKIYEADINDVFLGAHIQSNRVSDFFERGRIILSSLEVVPGSEDQQYIHWQRCKGKKVHASTYGDEGAGLLGEFPGMGPPGEEIIAYQGEAVMFVELAYDYEPIIADLFASARTMSATAAFNVRSNRDLAQIYQRDPGAPVSVASCDKFDGFSDPSA